MLLAFAASLGNVRGRSSMLQRLTMSLNTLRMLVYPLSRIEVTYGFKSETGKYFNEYAMK